MALRLHLFLALAELLLPCLGTTSGLGHSQRHALEQTVTMLRHAWSGYESHAFGHDEVRPVDCSEADSYGGIGMFLIDGLSALAIMNETESLQHAVQWLSKDHERSLFDVDKRVNVFEVNIRVLGGLLSAHQILISKPSLVPGYSDKLLSLAEDIASRLLHAFGTQSGIPLSWVNLRSGRIPGDTVETCTACAGTLMLEFGTLAQMTGNMTYFELAKHALKGVWARRSPVSGLVGNTLDTGSGQWLRHESGIGAGIDSFYEYLLKSYLLFGDDDFLSMFAQTYAAAMAHMRVNISGGVQYWLQDIQIHTGQRIHNFVSSLGSFWPGMQALVGQVRDAEGLFAAYETARKQFGFLPEMFDSATFDPHPIEKGHPLRPEHIESAYLLHATSGGSNDSYVKLASEVQHHLGTVKQPCGYASIEDVRGGPSRDFRVNNHMESFFLSETCFYLYLLFSGEKSILDHFVLSTEGHPLAIFDVSGDSPSQLPNLPNYIPIPCNALCNASVQSENDLQKEVRSSVLHDFDLDYRKALLLRRRRCLACIRVDASRREGPAKLPSAQQAATAQCGMPPPEKPSHIVTLCKWYVRGSALKCGSVQALFGSGINDAFFNQLTADTIVFQTLFENDVTVELRLLPEASSKMCTPANAMCDDAASRPTAPFLEAIAAMDLTFPATPAAFGPQLPETAEGRLVASLEIAVPPQACVPLQNEQSSVHGAWILIERGSCSFVDKVLHAQDVGAFGVIMVNTQDAMMFTMGGDGVRDAEVQIPAVFISGADGQRLREARDLRPADIGTGKVRTRSKARQHINVIVPPLAKEQIGAQAEQGLLSFDSLIDEQTKLLKALVIAGPGHAPVPLPR
eukprot:TRINITY_DN72130_c0_g1_i1.p1 TRINITY_DN72130_c0_g1~~TRINITY_DN72130_c0_g1_i1.p1  ORF type:complete len:854 (+),score=117.54 TRINITY_DN72130_c0_g1_i1:161-2722(+)